MDPPGVEPGIQPCRGCVIPFHYEPRVETEGVEPSLQRCERRVLPLSLRPQGDRWKSNPHLEGHNLAGYRYPTATVAGNRVELSFVAYQATVLPLNYPADQRSSETRIRTGKTWLTARRDTVSPSRNESGRRESNPHNSGAQGRRLTTKPSARFPPAGFEPASTGSKPGILPLDEGGSSL